jgi:TRAP-type C4-dicarboxylate transport system permease small subunit
MKLKTHLTAADRVMAGILAVAILLGVGIGVFCVGSMASHSYGVNDGLKALGACVVFIAICSVALRRRLLG